MINKPAGLSDELWGKWMDFLIRFSADSVEAMDSPNDYVIGLGNQNRSFCYCVEMELRQLGDIRGSSSSKFGLWFGRNGPNTEKGLRATKQDLRTTYEGW